MTESENITRVRVVAADVDTLRRALREYRSTVAGGVSQDEDGRVGVDAYLRQDQLAQLRSMPVEVEVGLQGGTAGVALDAPTFGAGLCQTGAGGCVLAPAARTNSSNYSSVDVQSGVPVWEAGLQVSGGPAPTAGTALSFAVRTSFTGASGKLFVEKTVQTAVKACP